MEKKSQQKHKNRLVAAVAGVVVIVAVVGAGLGVRASYQRGVDDGRYEMSSELAARVQALGVAVAGKAAFAQKVQQTIGEVPAEINSERIDEYIGKLEQLANELDVDAVKYIMEAYLEKWRDFKNIYASEDNGTISEAFNALRLAAEETTNSLQDYYDKAIRGAVEGL